MTEAEFPRLLEDIRKECAYGHEGRYTVLIGWNIDVDKERPKWEVVVSGINHNHAIHVQNLVEDALDACSYDCTDEASTGTTFWYSEFTGELLVCIKRDETNYQGDIEGI